MMASVKAEIKEELQAEEIRQILKEQAGRAEFQQLLDETADTAHSIDQLPKDNLEQLKRPHEPK
jgi:sec-independent protein translocase protein TatB